MQTQAPALAQTIARSLAAALAGQGSKVAALAISEGEALAQALVRIGGLLARGEVSRDEAGVLIAIQRDASEAVLASLAEVSRVAAGRAVGTALEQATTAISGIAADPGLVGLVRSLVR